jgi:hypothetical protein
MNRKKINPLVFLALGLLVVCSCKKLIKPDPSSSPEQNFEMFWNDVNNTYPYFVEDGIDWKARYEATRPTISSSTSIEQLYSHITSMLKGFSDGHLSVDYPGNPGYPYQNEKANDEVLQLVRADQSGAPLTYVDPIAYYYDNFNAISKSYMDPFTYGVYTAPDVVNPLLQDTICMYGTMDNGNVLYVAILSFLTNAPLDVQLEKIFTQRPYSQAKGMVLDLRMNGGGNLGIMWDAMGVFIPAGKGITEVKYAFNKQKVGPLPENFGVENYFSVPGNDGQQKYLKPVVVLTNRLTVSAAEHATMAMRQIGKTAHPKIKIMGDYTFGATSFVVERTLPNGITYTLVNSKTWDINRVIVEKIGVKPDSLVYLTPVIQQNQDEQLEGAIQVIRND